MIKDNLVLQKKSIIQLVSDIKRIHEKIQNEDQDISICADFDTLFNKYLGNHILIKSYLNFLKLINNEEILGEYELDDIEKAYNLLIEIYPDDSDLFIDYIYFKYNVMNNEMEAKKEYFSFKKKMLEKFEEVESYFNEMR